MNSFPVLLLPGGEQVDVPGTGGKPPGTDDTTASGDVFQGVLQQVLLGGAVQMLQVTPIPTADGGSSDSGAALPPGTGLSMGGVGVLSDSVSWTEQLRTMMIGGSALSDVSSGAVAESPPGLSSSIVSKGSEGSSLTPPLMFDTLPDVSDPREGEAAKMLTLLEEKGKRAIEASRVPADAHATAESRNPGRPADSVMPDAVLPTIPVSPKEGDVPPTRVQEAAPAAMKDAKVIAVEDRKEGVQSAVLRETEGQGVRQIAGANVSSQENALSNGSGQRSPLLYAAPQFAATPGEVLRTADVAGTVSGMFSQLPPDIARSVMNQVVKGFALQMNGGHSELRVKLEPESLGEVVLHVRMDEGKMQAQIDVTQAGVKAALESNLPQLRLSLSERGIDVQRLDVSFTGDHPANASGRGHGEGTSRQGLRRNAEVEAIEQYATGRLMGYNTMELVM